MVFYEKFNLTMRVITKGTLRDFWEQYPDSEQELKYWYDKMKNADYETPNDVIEDNPKSDTVKNNRIVFNICHNKYRLIAVFRYKLQRVFIRFIGTHKEYDKLENINNI
jgi:mRNA interferase HigB